MTIRRESSRVTAPCAVLYGAGRVEITLTGESIGPCSYGVTFDPLLDPLGLLPSALTVDLPGATARRCLSEGLLLRLEVEDGRSIAFIVQAIGPGGPELGVVGSLGAPMH